MDDFAILTNRKRALVALAHSVVFLGIAIRGFASSKSMLDLHSPGMPLAIALLFVYLAVASILASLALVARCAKERGYFLFCASSASFGFLRTLFGDVSLPAAQYLRVTMLLCAVLMGVWISLSFEQEALPD
jgi:hypothetical protein